MRRISSSRWRRTSGWLLIAGLTVTIALIGCGGAGVPGNAVVSVSGIAISQRTLDHWMNVAAAEIPVEAGETKLPVPVPPRYTVCIAGTKAQEANALRIPGQPLPSEAALKADCEKQYKSIREEALGFLIGLAWKLGEASALDVSVSDAEVERQFEKLEPEQFRTRAVFEKSLAMSRHTIADVLLTVKVDLLTAKIKKKIVESEVRVSRAQISQNYDTHLKAYMHPEKRDFLAIVTKTEAAAMRAKREIESGKRFENVAESIPKHVASAPKIERNGGKMSITTNGYFGPPLDTAILSARRGALIGPIKSRYGYAVVEVQKITPAFRATLEQSEAKIRSQLIELETARALNKYTKERRKKWKAKTSCRPGYLVEDCKQYTGPEKTSTEEL